MFLLLSTINLCISFFYHDVTYVLYTYLYLRWLYIVSSTYILMGCYDHSLSLDATIMVSKNWPTIGEHVVTIFVTQ